MNIIVTGGNGYLGSNIIKKLIKENHNVLILSKNNNNIQSILNHCQFISSYADELEINIDKIKLFSPDVILLFGWNGGNNHKDVNDTNQYHKNIPYYIKFLELLCIEFCEKWLNRYQTSNSEIEKFLIDLNYEQTDEYFVDKTFTYKN